MYSWASVVVVFQTANVRGWDPWRSGSIKDSVYVNASSGVAGNQVGERILNFQELKCGVRHSNEVPRKKINTFWCINENTPFYFEY
jgi:hypothetical protein